MLHLSSADDVKHNSRLRDGEQKSTLRAERASQIGVCAFPTVTLTMGRDSGTSAPAAAVWCGCWFRQVRCLAVSFPLARIFPTQNTPSRTATSGFVPSRAPLPGDVYIFHWVQKRAEVNYFISSRLRRHYEDGAIEIAYGRESEREKERERKKKVAKEERL